MSDWQQVGDVAIEALVRSLARRAADTDDAEAARQLREVLDGLKGAHAEAEAA